MGQKVQSVFTVQTSNQTTHISATITATSMSMMVDSGATHSCVSGIFYNQYQQVQGTLDLSTTPDGANTNALACQGIADPLEIELEGKTMSP